MRMTDLFLSLPQLPLLLLIVYLFRDAMKAIASPEIGIFLLVVLLIGGLNWMTVARLVRGNILKLREMEFMSAAIALGARPRRLIWQHLFPNVFNIIIVAATLAIGNAIITESTLSFIGLGDPFQPSWGTILGNAQSAAAPSLGAWWFITAPGCAILVTVVACTIIGNAIDELLDRDVRVRR